MIVTNTKWEVFVVVYTELRDMMLSVEIRITHWQMMMERLSSEVDDLVRMNLTNEVSCSVVKVEEEIEKEDGGRRREGILKGS